MITIAQAKAALKNERYRTDPTMMTQSRQLRLDFIVIKEVKNICSHGSKKAFYQTSHFVGTREQARWDIQGNFETLGKAIAFLNTVYADAEKAWNADETPAQVIYDIKYAYPTSEIASKFGYKAGCAYLLVPGQPIRSLLAFPCASPNSGEDGITDALVYANRNGLKLSAESLAWANKRGQAVETKAVKSEIDKGELFREAHKLTRSARRPGCTYKEDFAAALRIVWTSLKRRASQALLAA